MQLCNSPLLTRRGTWRWGIVHILNLLQSHFEANCDESLLLTGRPVSHAIPGKWVESCIVTVLLTVWWPCFGGFSRVCRKYRSLSCLLTGLHDSEMQPANSANILVSRRWDCDSDLNVPVWFVWACCWNSDFVVWIVLWLLWMKKECHVWLSLFS
jgi:hypothetical protein